MKYGVVIPSRVDSNLYACIDSLRQMGEECPVWVVDDGLSERRKLEAVTYLDGKKPFIFARNANIGLDAAFSDGCEGVLLLNDDTRLLTPNGVRNLAFAAGHGSDWGGLISAAVTDAVGNLRQRPVSHDPEWLHVRHERQTLAFVAIWIPRSTWMQVGRLDESFTDYGGEDNDYCHRVKMAGMLLIICDNCIFEHGVLPSTFRGADASGRPKSRDISAAVARLREKWGAVP